MPNSPNPNPGETHENRASRFQRAVEEKRKCIQLNQLDKDILEIVGRARFIDALQLHALSGGKRNTFQIRLRKLFGARYLDRPLPQQELRTNQGTAALVYALGPKSGDVLGEKVKRNNEVGVHFMRHTLLVTTHYVTIETACRQGGMTLNQWVNEPPFPSLELPEYKKEVSHRPDAMFTIKQNGTTETFCLEVDRGTVPGTRDDIDQSHWLKTINFYQELYVGREKILGISNFRVLISTTGIKRVTSLIELIRKTGPKQHGPGIFWCTTHKALFQPAHLQSFLFDPIWVKPDSNSHALFAQECSSRPLSVPSPL